MMKKLFNSKEAGGKNAPAKKSERKGKFKNWKLWAAGGGMALMLAAGLISECRGKGEKKERTSVEEKAERPKVSKTPQIGCEDEIRKRMKRRDGICTLEEGEPSSPHYCDNDCNPAKKLCGNGKTEKNKWVRRTRVVWIPPKKGETHGEYSGENEIVVVTEVNPGTRVATATGKKRRDRIHSRRLEEGESHMFYDEGGRLNVIHACKEGKEPQPRTARASSRPRPITRPVTRPITRPVTRPVTRPITQPRPTETSGKCSAKVKRLARAEVIRHITFKYRGKIKGTLQSIGKNAVTVHYKVSGSGSIRITSTSISAVTREIKLRRAGRITPPEGGQPCKASLRYRP